MRNRVLAAAFLCFLVGVEVSPAIAHPGGSIVVDAKGQVYFVDTGHGVWMVDAAGTLVDLGGPAFHWMALDSDSRLSGLRGRGDSFEFVAKAIAGGVLILSSDYPVAIRDGFVHFAPYARQPPLRVMRMARDGRAEPAAVIDTRAQWLNGFAAGRDGLYFTEDAVVKRLASDGSVSVVADNVMPADCPTNWLPDMSAPYLRGLAVGDAGDVYVAATGCRVVMRIDRRGAATAVLRAEHPWAPTAVALRGDDVYVLEYLHTPGDDRREWLPRVRKVDSSGRVTTVASVNRPTR